MIKLIVTDIDGTIVKSDNTLTPEMIKCLKDLNKKGIKIVLASGRMHPGVFPVAELLGLDTPVISYQGAMVREFKNSDKILWHKSISNDLTREIIDFLRQFNVHINLYSDDVLYTEDDNYMDDYTYGRFVSYTKVECFSDVKPGRISKLLVIEYDPEKIAKIKAALEKKFGSKLDLVLSTPFYLEITAKGATKGEAVKFLAQHWGYDMSEILCCGDQDNDISMVEIAGVGVAMGNASKKLKKAADYICGTVDENGLTEAFERFVK